MTEHDDPYGRSQLPRLQRGNHREIDRHEREERVRREEAMVKGLEEVATSSLEEQFAQLESGDDDETEVDARFAELKASGKTELLPA